MSEPLHPLLARQLKKFGVTDVQQLPDPASWPKLLERLNRSYIESDNDRYTLERSLSLSSEEMQELHKKLERQNKVMHQILTRYVNDEVANEILSNPEEKLRLGGDTRLVTVLFADIRNYTGFSKSKDARLIINVLNTIFQRLVPEIFEERGTFDKFLGDAIMCFFGAPTSHSDDALRAVRSAAKMQIAMQQLRIDDPSLEAIEFGVGVFTGYAVVGNLGSDQIMNYTCVGDTPNSAKRLQENAKGGQILICPATYEAVLDDVDAAPTEMLHLKGRKAPMLAYEVTAIEMPGLSYARLATSPDRRTESPAD